MKHRTEALERLAPRVAWAIFRRECCVLSEEGQREIELELQECAQALRTISERSARRVDVPLVLDHVFVRQIEGKVRLLAGKARGEGLDVRLEGAVGLEEAVGLWAEEALGNTDETAIRRG